MTVEQLIAALKKFPPQSKVILGTDDNPVTEVDEAFYMDGVVFYREDLEDEHGHIHAEDLAGKTPVVVLWSDLL